MSEQKFEIRNQKLETKHLIQVFLFFMAFLLLLPSCKNRVDDISIDYEYEYYPLDSGRYIIYDVDSIKYSWQPVGSGSNSTYIQYIDTIRYQWKELYAGTFYDNFQGVLKHRIEYYRRKSQDDPWQNDRVWYALKTPTNLQRQEDDLRFMKLVFPPREGYTWDGTVFIPKTGIYDFFSEWKFKYSNVGKSFSVNGRDFQTTVIVDHVNVDDNKIFYQFSREIFAKNVGVIYRDWDKFSKNVLSSNDNPQQAEGFRIRMRINSYYP